MLGYLKKFNNLPAELRERVSNKKAMAAIEELEKKYKLPLASFIMRVMVREIASADLVSALLKENLSEMVAGQLAQELKEKIFYSLEDYLSPPVSPKIERVEPKPDLSSLTKVAPTGAIKPLAQTVEPSERPAVRGASFFFSPDDEQEIRDLTKKIDLAEKTTLSFGKIEEKLDAIIKRVQINFGSVDLAERFKQILKTYLRGIRNKLEAKLTLIKPFSSGGLSFDEESAEKVMALADKVLNFKPDSLNPDGPAGEIIKLPSKIPFAELKNSRTEQPIIVRDAPYDFSVLPKQKKSSDLKESRPEIGRFKIEDVGHELAPLTPVRLAETPAPAQAVAAKPRVEVRPRINKPAIAKVEDKVLSQAAEDISQMPLIRRRFEAENLNRNQKIKVEDVKYIPRVMSPLDEIRYLDLINFRRLDKDPQRAIEKIKSKINLLEEEGYDKRMEAIKGWRSSPLNGLYLEIGRLSIGGNKPVDVIIEERKFKAVDYLTAAEFEAIMDLNKSLRF